jgi:hypothetical protein
LLGIDTTERFAKSTSANSLFQIKEQTKMDMSPRNNTASQAHQQLQRMLTILEFGGSVPQQVVDALLEQQTPKPQLQNK